MQKIINLRIFLFILGVGVLFLFFLYNKKEYFIKNNAENKKLGISEKLLKNDLKEEDISNLKEYQKSIDYSCSNDDECVIKDVHNCCGYYPECVNLKTEVRTDLVNSFCEKESLTSVCGFESISGCKCVSGRCESFYDENIGEIEVLE